MLELAVDKKRTTNLMIKGNFLTKGAAVRTVGSGKISSVAERFRPIAWGSRVGLPIATTPLTARVMANRLWAQLFGIGAGGNRGGLRHLRFTLPTNQALLDWLAVELMEPTTSPPLRKGGQGGADELATDGKISGIAIRSPYEGGETMRGT